MNNAKEMTNEQEEITHWRKEFALAQERHQQLVLAGEWTHGDADLLGIIGRSYYETYHCRMLAWMLDPCGRHGLRTLFLEWMLNACFPNDPFDDQMQLASAQVQYEVTREHVRADIVVWCRNLTLVIEAKIGHYEHEGQSDDQHRLFRHEPGARFIFLTQGNEQPQSPHFRVLRFHQIRDWLQTVCETPSDLVRKADGWHTLNSYLQTLNQLESP